MINVKSLCRGLAAGLLLVAASGAHAVAVTNLSITGIIDSLGTNVTYKKYDASGVVFDPVTNYNTTNLFGFTSLPSSITASLSFTNAWSASYTGTILFDAASGNTLTINGGTGVLYASGDSGYTSGGFPALHFTNGQLDDFDYLKTTVSKFQSNFLSFNDLTYVAPIATGLTGKINGKNWTQYTVVNALAGHWVATPVPEASTYAMMLAGLGLVGFMGAARKKKLQAAA